LEALKQDSCAICYVDPNVFLSEDNGNAGGK